MKNTLEKISYWLADTKLGGFVFTFGISGLCLFILGMILKTFLNINFIVFIIGGLSVSFIITLCYILTNKNYKIKKITEKQLIKLVRILSGTIEMTGCESSYVLGFDRNARKVLYNEIMKLQSDAPINVEDKRDNISIPGNVEDKGDNISIPGLTYQKLD